MTDSKTDHPFVPGARVAVRDRYGDGYTEGFVDKIYKTGHFVLRGETQRWRAYHYGDGRWSATETGSNYSRRRLDLWDETTDAEISAKIEATKAKQRWNKIIAKIERVREPTTALCDAVEATLATIEPPK
jgi:hypothetical protein